MRKKLKDTGGLTMVELLCAVAILILLCLMMNTGLSMAVRSYRDITAESEAQLLLNDLSDALADKLRYAVVTEGKNASGDTERKIFITQNDENNIIDVSTGAVAKAAVRVENGKIVVDTVTKTNPDGTPTTTGKQLLPEGAYGAYGQFSAAYIGRYTVAQVDDSTPLVTYNENKNSFTVKFKVTDEKVGITRTAEFTVRCLSPVKKEV